jgi:hypothetical protein
MTVTIGRRELLAALGGAAARGPKRSCDRRRQTTECDPKPFDILQRTGPLTSSTPIRCAALGHPGVAVQRCT